jgi:hypothetical protein
MIKKYVNEWKYIYGFIQQMTDDEIEKNYIYLLSSFFYFIGIFLPNYKIYYHKYPL